MITIMNLCRIIIIFSPHRHHHHGYASITSITVTTIIPHHHREALAPLRLTLILIVILLPFLALAFITNILSWKCASRHSPKCSRHSPKLTCFVHFHLKMCFSPEWRAIFRRRNFKKCSETFFFSILSWKCASRNSGVQFFDIGT